jgi:hypothetical protein
MRPTGGGEGTREGLDEELLVELFQVLVGCDGEQVGPHAREHARTAGGVVHEGATQPVGEEVRSTGLGEHVVEPCAEFVLGERFKGGPDADTTAQGQEIRGPEALRQAAVPTV